MYVIVGLGNPGRKYENTKHNMGFLTIDAFAEKHDIKVNRIKHKALVGEGFISGKKVMLVKPQTYMNLSGQSVREIVSYYDIQPEELMVIYDDVDIPAGAIRIRKKGSAGTHNGMKSIIYDLQFDNFPRLRVGIGTENKGDMINFVLSGFTGDDKKKVEAAITNSVSALEAWLDKGIDIAMGEYNTKKEKKPKPERKAEQDGKSDADGNGKTPVSGASGDIRESGDAGNVRESGDAGDIKQIL